MKKRFRQIIAAGLAAILVAGCGSTASTSSASSASGSAASSAAGETTFSVSDSAAAPAGSTASIAGGESLAGGLTINSRRGGGLTMIPAENELEETDEDGADEMDRAIRAYTPSGSTLLENNAEEFYYYEQLEGDTETLYDIMYQIASDPGVDEGTLTASFTVSADPAGDEFQEAYWQAYYALVYDHPELFWLYNFIETTMQGRWIKSGDQWKVYMYLEEPFSDYKTMMNAFNDAAEDFLADIDTDQTEREIARDVHDKLMNLVTYDTAVADKGEAADLAHTAYGCLVEDSDGNKNYAVCDGYALAYEYLLQQLGITAVVVTGMAGETQSDAGGHAWNLANLDGKWYEIDCTWDDDDGAYASYADDSRVDSRVRECLNDTSFVDKLQHAYYELSTSGMRNFKASKDEYYTASDGTVFTILGSSVHIRMSDVTPSSAITGYVGDLIKNAPVAS